MIAVTFRKLYELLTSWGGVPGGNGALPFAARKKPVNGTCSVGERCQSGRKRSKIRNT